MTTGLFFLLSGFVCSNWTLIALWIWLCLAVTFVYRKPALNQKSFLAYQPYIFCYLLIFARMVILIVYASTTTSEKLIYAIFAFMQANATAVLYYVIKYQAEKWRYCEEGKEKNPPPSHSPTIFPNRLKKKPEVPREKSPPNHRPSIFRDPTP